MTKNIIIGILLLISGAALIYAHSKANEADDFKIEAEKNSKLAERYIQIAKEEEVKAVHAAAKARIAERKAVELEYRYKDCK